MCVHGYRLGALLIAAWKRAWATIGLVVLALTVGFMVIARLGALSFSMNAGLVPILLTSVFTLIALRFKTADRDGLALLLRIACRYVAGIRDDDSFAIVLIVGGLSGPALARPSQLPNQKSSGSFRARRD